MRLRNITLEGFQSYRERETVDLRGLNLTAVIGANHTGKSTLISNAVDYALFGRSRGANVSDVVSRGSARAEVSVEFDLGDATYRVKRSRTAKGNPEAVLYVSDPAEENGWRALSEKNALNTDPAIIDLLGMDAQTAGLTWLIRQNDYGALCDMLPAERRAALNDAFGLTKYNDLAREAKARRSAVAENYRITQHDLERLERRRESLAVEGPYPEIDDDDLQEAAEKAEAAVEDAAARLRELGDNAALQEALRVAQAALDAFNEAHRRAVALHGRERAHADKVLSDALGGVELAARVIREAEQEVRSAEERHEGARQKQIQVSEAAWVTDDLVEDHEDAVSAATKAEETLTAAQTAESDAAARRSVLASEQASAEQRAAAADRARAAHEQDRERAESTLSAAETALSTARAAEASTDALKETLTAAENALESSEGRQREARERLTSLGTEIASVKAAIRSDEDRRTELDGALASLRDSQERGEGVCLSCRRPMSEDETATQIAEQEEQIATLARKIAEREEQVAGLVADEVSVKNALADADADVETKRQARDAARADVRENAATVETITALVQQVDEATKSLASLTERIEAQDAEAREAREAREKAAQKIAELDEAREPLRAEVERAQKARDAARADEVDARDRLNANRALVAESDAVDAAVTKAAADLERRKTTLAEAQDGPARAEAALVAARKQAAEVGDPPQIDHEKQTALVAERDKAQDAWDATSDVERARARITQERDQARTRARGLWQEQERRKQIGASLAALQPEQEALNAKADGELGDMAAYDVMVDAFSPSGIPYMMLSGIIEELNDEANDVMETLSDDGLSVLVSTSNEGKSGNTVEKVMIYAMTADGMVDYSTLSGSEQMRVALAIRLGLTRCIAKRSGNPLMTIIADECFAAFDPTGRQTLMNMFIRLSGNEGGAFSIFAIAHMADLTDAFPDVIEVTNTAGTSHAEVLTS